MQTQTQTQTSQVSQTKERKIVYVKVRYYVGANNRLTFYIPTANGVEKIQVIVTDQKWVTEIINYLKTKGKYRKVKHYGYSSFARMHHVYTNDVWTAKIPAKKLLNLIKSTKSWSRSGYATKIVQLLEQRQS
jgi:nicotinamide mononucleotide adenylyltransferase